MKNNWSQDKYLEAYRFAAEKHTNECKKSKKGQLFPGTNWCYVVHLSMVSMEIIAALNYELDINGDLAVQTAILHDTIEDTYTTHEELELEFGQKVADGVQSLTKDEDIEEHDRMADSLSRIKKQPKEIWMVKLADRITNLQPPPEYWNNEKRKKYLAQARIIYDDLKGASEYLANRLKKKIQTYQTYIGG
jgi:(p)ppGpp synthase/HD superfamily hydrolase